MLSKWIKQKWTACRARGRPCKLCHARAVRALDPPARFSALDCVERDTRLEDTVKVSGQIYEEVGLRCNLNAVAGRAVRQRKITRCPDCYRTTVASALQTDRVSLEAP